ncbi:fibronectin type III domain-containing protein [Eubacterium sp. MSJ-21]|nr:fibronectin type III domain-containing protein [Eubacterium sp. MSJ-21]
MIRKSKLWKKMIVGFATAAVMLTSVQGFSGSALVVHAATSAQYQPMTIASGFNADVFYDAGENFAETDSAESSDKVNGNKACFYTAASGVAESGGFPADGIIADESVSGLTWKLNSYNMDNALRLAPGANGAITFSTIGCYQKLNFLVTAGGVGTGHDATMNVTVTYTDGATSDQTFVVRDWYDPTNSVTAQYMRTYTGDAANGSTTSGPYLTRCEMDIDTTKLIQNIQISNSANNTDVYVCVYAVTGLGAAIAAPEPSASDVTANGFKIGWNPVDDATSYRVDVATDENFTNMLAGYNNLVVDTTSVDVSGLNPYTEYFYRVRAVDGNGGQSISSETKYVETTAHTHSWSLTAAEDPAVAKAACSVDGCKYKESPATLTLKAEDMAYTGKAYNKASVTGNLIRVTGATLAYTYYVKTGDDFQKDQQQGLEAAPSNAGSYWVVCEITAGESNVKVVDSFTITKATPKVSVTGRNNLTYTGNKLALVASNTTGGTVYYRLGTGGTWSTEIPTAVDASQEDVAYEVYYYVAGDTNYEGVGSEETPAGKVMVYIDKADIPVSENHASGPYQEGKTYTSTVTTEIADAKIEYSDSYYGSYRAEPYSYEDVGDYETYYRVSTGNPNYKTTTGYLMTHVQGKQFANGDIKVEGYDGIYDGEEHTISVTVFGTAEGADIEYATQYYGEYSTDPITVKNVTASGYDDYKTIYYRVSKKGYYQKISSARVKITPKQLDASVIAADKRYDGTQDADVEAVVDTGVAGETLTISGVKGSFENPAAGENKRVSVDSTAAQVSAPDNVNSGNYKIVYPKETTASITPRIVTLEWAQTTFNYTGENQTITATVANAVAGEEVELTYAGNMQKEVGSYTAEVLSVSDSNYTLEGTENITCNWKIQSYETAVTATPVSSAPGGHGWSRGEVTLQAEGYQISQDGVTWSDSISCSSEGERQVGYYLKETATGYITALKTLTIKIDTEAPTGTIQFSQTNEKGESVFADEVVATIVAEDASSGIESIEYLIVPNGENVDLENADWVSGNQVTLQADQKSDIYAKLTDMAGNTCVIDSKSVVVYTAATAKAEAEYECLATEDIVTGIAVNGNKVAAIKNGEKTLPAEAYAVEDGKVVLKNTYLKALEAGTYTLMVSYLPVDDAVQTSPRDSVITLHVVHIQGQVTNIADLSKVYDGAVTVNPTFDTTNHPGENNKNVTIEYKEKNAEDSAYTKSAPKNVGEYVVRVTVAEDACYAEAVGTAEFTIAPKKVEVKVNDTSKHVGMEDPHYTYTVTGLVKGETLTEIMVSRVSGEAVGEYKIIPSLDETGNPNYEIQYEAGTLTIEDHDWSDAWVEIQEATETTEGEKEKTCAVDGCGQKKYAKIPVIGAVADPNEGKLEKDAQVTPESPIRKATLNNKATELLEADGIFTESEKAQLENGSKANVWLEVSELDPESLSTAEKGLVAQEAVAFAGRDVDITYFNADLYKQVDGNARTQIHEPKTDIRVTIRIPESLINTNAAIEREYRIIRLHNGETTLIRGVYNENAREFSFVTNEFSTYAIIYKDSAKQITPEDPTTEVPTTETPTTTEVSTTEAPATTTEPVTSETQVITPEGQKTESAATTEAGTGNQTGATATGDSFEPVIWLAMMGAALLAFLGLLNKKYKDSREDDDEIQK